VGIYLSRFQRPATGEDITYVRMAFCGDIGELQAHLKLDEGIVRTLWMTPDEVRASADRHRSPLVLRCIEDHLAGQRFPLDVIYTDAAVADLPPLTMIAAWPNEALWLLTGAAAFAAGCSMPLPVAAAF
jgi:hypothetical protein